MVKKVHEPKSINEAINDLQVFLESDMWHCIKEVWKNEEDMIKYLRGHFRVLRRQIKKIGGKK